MGTSQKEKENKALRALIANANQEDVDEEEIRKIVKNIAEKIVAAREKVQLKRKELRKKEKALMDAELENLRRATFDPPRAPQALRSCRHRSRLRERPSRRPDARSLWLCPLMGMRILGWGSALPLKTITNADLEAQLDTSDEWIVERTGIRERRVGGSTAELAVAAGHEALAHAGADATSIDLVIVCTTTPGSTTGATSRWRRRSSSTSRPASAPSSTPTCASSSRSRTSRLAWRSACPT